MNKIDFGVPTPYVVEEGSSAIIETINVEKELEDLRYMYDNALTELYKRLEEQENNIETIVKNDTYFFQSIDNLLLLIAFMQENIVKLEEGAQVVTAQLWALENAPFYKKFTTKQKHDILLKAEKDARKKFSPIREKGEKNTKEIINGIYARKGGKSDGCAD